MESFLFVGPCTYLNGKRLIQLITNFANAMKYGHLEIIKRFISKNSDIKVKNKTIISASQNGHLDVVKYLVSLGADITANNDEAIRYASTNGHLQMVKYLVSVGADITAENNYAVRLASANGFFKTAKYLVSLGDRKILFYGYDTYGNSYSINKEKAEKFRRKMNIVALMKR